MEPRHKKGSWAQARTASGWLAPTTPLPQPVIRAETAQCHNFKLHQCVSRSMELKFNMGWPNLDFMSHQMIFASLCSERTSIAGSMVTLTLAQIKFFPFF